MRKSFRYLALSDDELVWEMEYQAQRLELAPDDPEPFEELASMAREAKRRGAQVGPELRATIMEMLDSRR